MMCARVLAAQGAHRYFAAAEVPSSIMDRLTDLTAPATPSFVRRSRCAYVRTAGHQPTWGRTAAHAAFRELRQVTQEVPRSRAL